MAVLRLTEKSTMAVLYNTVCAFTSQDVWQLSVSKTPTTGMKHHNNSFAKTQPRYKTGIKLL